MDKNENVISEEQKIRLQLRDLGSRLKSIRQAQNLSITDISDATKIQKHYLAAIEEGDLERLPKGPYVRSFIRHYCNYLSAQDIWKSYDTITKKQREASPPIPSADEANYSDSHKIFKPRSFLWIYILIVLSVGAAGWITWQYRGDITTSATSPIDGGTAGAVRPPAQEGPAVPVSAEVSDQAVSADGISADEQVDLSWMDGKDPQPGRTAAADAERVPDMQTAARQRYVKVTAENAYVWTKVSQGDKVLYEGTLKPAEYREFEIGKDLPVRVRIGKPGSVSIEWEGKRIFPAAAGERPATKFFWPDGKMTDN